MKCVRIGYYNVKFDLMVKSEEDLFVIECMTNQIDKGQKFCMRDIDRWCSLHNIEYKADFAYRKDLPIKANIWNLYSYWRFCREKNKVAQEKRDHGIE